MSLYGFDNYHFSEAIEGALPDKQNSPQHCPYDLYAEQLSGTSFTRPRHKNLHSWLYRTLPSVTQGSYSFYEHQIIHAFLDKQAPNPMRWAPLQVNSQGDCDFIKGLFHFAGTTALQVFHYYCNLSMKDSYFSSYDGELLFVPYEGEIKLHTEFGSLNLRPPSIAVIPRGIKFKVEVLSKEARGYLCENGASPLTLPQLGPIGSNGLANPLHFQYPKAAFEQSESPSLLICKHLNQLWSAQCKYSPLNVVGWHGNYAPYSYDLSLFNTINTVSFDHPDPSIYTVLTSESDTPGVANLDFVIFPPRWLVAEHTFRPPYFHRNCMSELMGLIYGDYDAKKEGFAAGGISVHNQMTAHGPDKSSYELAVSKDLKPEYLDSLAFMFESKDVWHVTEQAYQHSSRENNYSDCWKGLENKFKPKS